MSNHPTRLRDMTDAEIAALMRAHWEGKTIEYWYPDGGFWDTCYSDEPIWLPYEAYRVKPEVTETRHALTRSTEGGDRIEALELALAAAEARAAAWAEWADAEAWTQKTLKLMEEAK